MTHPWQSRTVFFTTCFFCIVEGSVLADPANLSTLDRRVENLEQDVKNLKTLQVKFGEQIQKYATHAPSSSNGNINIRPPSSKTGVGTSPPDRRNRPNSNTTRNFIAYKKAQSLVRSNPKAAIKVLKNYIDTYPDSNLTVNAIYWSGEAKYALRNFQGAIDDFVKVLKVYKKSPKAPAAALKLGYSFYELRKWQFARNTLEDVVKFFPKSRAASLAKQRLNRMTQQGH